MGRIKSRTIKKTAIELAKREYSFNSNFNNNKVILKSTVPSKKVRNQIAGYITRIKKQQSIINQ